MDSHQRHKYASTDLVRFGDFALDTHTGELRRGDRVVALRPLATRGLLLLAKRAGRLVTLEELRQELWGKTVVDWRAGTHQVIRQIRRALGDDDHAMVETVTRHGYRFRVKVTPVTPVAKSRSVLSGFRFPRSRAYAAGFATPILLVVLFFLACGSIA